MKTTLIPEYRYGRTITSLKWGNRRTDPGNPGKPYRRIQFYRLAKYGSTHYHQEAFALTSVLDGTHASGSSADLAGLCAGGGV